MKIALINGPNINLLGTREPNVYGNETYNDLISLVYNYCIEKKHDLTVFQSNHEGAIVDHIQDLLDRADGIIINPAAYTHYSIAILDVLSAVNIPYIEVHISDINEREEFRKKSITGVKAVEIIKGYGFKGYLMAVDKLEEIWN
ncbi:MAG: type II 3-dehydroquinate dehydratase [Lachnospirales bacterium]